LGVSSNKRMPFISILSTKGFTSPVKTMLLPPPKMNLWAAPHVASDNT